MNDGPKAEPFPLLVWPIVFRFAAAAWFTVGAGFTLLRSHYSPSMDGGFGIAVAVTLVVAPHMIIAAGLLRRRVWAGWLAITGDCTVGAAALGVTLGSMFPRAAPFQAPSWDFGAPALVIGGLSLVEGTYLMRQLRQPWEVTVAYLLSAALLLLGATHVGSVLAGLD